MKTFELAEYGLLTVAQASDKYGWAPKTIQNWVHAGLIPAAPVGSARGTFLLRKSDLDAFTPPPRGRPHGSTRAAPADPAPKPARKRKPS